VRTSNLMLYLFKLANFSRDKLFIICGNDSKEVV
jgi:hypothetical protein